MRGCEWTCVRVTWLGCSCGADTVTSSPVTRVALTVGINHGCAPRLSECSYTCHFLCNQGFTTLKCDWSHPTIVAHCSHPHPHAHTLDTFFGTTQKLLASGVDKASNIINKLMHLLICMPLYYSIPHHGKCTQMHK